MKQLLKIAYLLAFGLIMLTACSDDDESSLSIEMEGVLVLNEGSGGGSISYINPEIDSVVNNIYEKVNNIPLGELPQAMAMSDKYIFITVTTSKGAGYVEVVDRSTLEHVTDFQGLSYPREVVVGDDYAYVSNGNYNGSLYSISLSTLELDTLHVSIGNGPEKMIVDNDKLFVANSGGWSSDSTVSVVDLRTNSVVKTINVKPGPKDMVLDADGNIWVYCSGEVSYDASWNATYEKSGLCVVSTSDYSVSSFDINIPNSAVKSIAINSSKDIIYYMTNAAVYAMDIDATTLPTTPLINRSFYGIDIDPINDNIWVCNVNSYSSASDVIVYSKDGTELQGYIVGVIPNSSLFNR